MKTTYGIKILVFPFNSNENIIHCKMHYEIFHRIYKMSNEVADKQEIGKNATP